MNKLVRFAVVTLIVVGSAGIPTKAEARPMMCGAIERMIETVPYDNSAFQQWAYNYYFSRCYGE